MSSQNFENLLLKSLIEDLDTANGFPNSKNFSEFEKNFHNSSSSINTNSSTKSDKDTSAMSPQQQNMTFSKKDILNAYLNFILEINFICIYIKHLYIMQDRFFLVCLFMNIVLLL